MARSAILGPIKERVGIEKNRPVRRGHTLDQRSYVQKKKAFTVDSSGRPPTTPWPHPALFLWWLKS